MSAIRQGFAFVELFVVELFIAYKNNLLEQKALEIKKIKEEARKEKEAKKKAKLEAKKIVSLSYGDDDEDLPCDDWNVNVDEASVLKTFTF